MHRLVNGCTSARFPCAHRLQLLVLLVLLVSVAPVRAQPLPWIMVALGERGSYHDAFHEAFRSEIQTRFQGKVQIVDVDVPLIDIRHSGALPDLVVSVGARATRVIADTLPSTPQLAVMVPRQLARQVQAERGAGFSALWLDPPPRKVLELFRLLLPAGRRLGVVHGPELNDVLPEVRAAARGLGIEIVSERIARPADLVPALSHLLPGVDGLLALPDSLAYTRATIRPLLLTAYRFRKPVIAISAGAVASGALAAVFPTTEQIAAEAATLVMQVLEKRQEMPAPQPASGLAVAVNRHVADGLSLNPPPDTALREMLDAAQP